MHLSGEHSGGHAAKSCACVGPVFQTSQQSIASPLPRIIQVPRSTVTPELDNERFLIRAGIIAIILFSILSLLIECNKATNFQKEILMLRRDMIKLQAAGY